MIQQVFKDKKFANVFLLFFAVVITILTGLFARLGDEYRCDHNDYIEQAKDARGIPFIYLQRSVQSTGCSPQFVDGTPVPNYGRHTIDTTAIFLDVLFWYILLVGLRAFFKYVDNQK